MLADKAIMHLIACLSLLVLSTVDVRASERPLTYQIHCEGCHKADGSGLEGFIPSFVDQLSSYLHLPEGRNFIIQVPGVSQSSLSDGEVADLMNWMVVAYDPSGVPDSFTPYTVREVAALRSKPLSNATGIRAAVLKQLDASRKVAASEGYRYATASAQGSSAKAETAAASPPASFALCGACHTTSADGANGMGPNLRGIIGRSSGTFPGFAFSKAMQDSDIVWNEEELNQFVQSPRKVVPNTSMTYFGEADPVKRKEIVDYLVTLD